VLIQRITLKGSSEKITLPQARPLRSLAIFCISLFEILVPIFCAVVFLLWQMRIIELHAGRSPLFQAWMPGIAAFASVGVSVMNFASTYKKLRDEQANENHGVIVQP
jgi:hypothetical protein